MTTYDKEYLQERHLRGELTTEEQTAFDQMLASDPEFAREVKAGELAVEGLKSLHIRQRIQEVRQQVGDQQKEKEAPTELKKKPGRVISIFRRPLSIAASVLVLVVAAYFIYLSFGSQSLYDQYNQHPTFAVTEMSASADYDLSRAEAAFQKGDYEVTQQELSAYLNARPTDTLALLFQGICQLELDNFSQAEGIFSDIQAGTSDFRDLGEWYLALTFLKQEDTERAREVLSNIAQDSEKYADAQALLGALKK
jgi:hypothetical protein